MKISILSNTPRSYLKCNQIQKNNYSSTTNKTQLSDTVSFGSHINAESVKMNKVTQKLLCEIEREIKNKESALTKKLAKILDEFKQINKKELGVEFATLPTNEKVSINKLSADAADGSKVFLATQNNGLSGKFHLSIKSKDDSFQSYIIDSNTIQKIGAEPKGLNKEVQEYLNLFLVNK